MSISIDRCSIRIALVANGVVAGSDASGVSHFGTVIDTILQGL